MTPSDLGFELFNENGYKFYGSYIHKIFPIHPLSDAKKEQMREETHHYADIFTKDVLTALPDKVYVDGTEFVVNKNRRLVIVSYDGKLNLWQNAPTFYSTKNIITGTPIVDSDNKIVSIVTGNKNGYYAIICFDGFSGKLETKRSWQIVERQCGIIYGNKCFKTREELWNYLKDRKFGNTLDLQAIVVDAVIPRIILFDNLSGLEISHSYIRGEFETEVCEKYE